jgi:hypothetical protein
MTLVCLAAMMFAAQLSFFIGKINKKITGYIILPLI